MKERQMCTYVHIYRISLAMPLYFMDGNKKKILYKVI